MSITVEFFGMARRRAGIERLDIEAATLGEALDRLADRLPDSRGEFLREGRLAAGYLASRNGRQFLSDRTAPLAEGDSLLILSADVGG
jgi:molybdopterin converting factor small subunit